MASFFWILVFMTFGFTLIFVQYTMNENNSDFGTELYNTYNLYFGNVNETYTAPQMIYFLIFTVFVSVVMLNMLIAVINETFGRISDNQEYYESEAKISLIIEALVIKRFTQRVFGPLKTFSPRGLARAYCNNNEGRIPNFLSRFLREPPRVDGHLYIAKEITKAEYEELIDEMKNKNRVEKTTDLLYDESLRTDIRSVLKDELKMLLKEKPSGEEDLAKSTRFIEQAGQVFEQTIAGEKRTSEVHHKVAVTKFKAWDTDE